MAFKQVRRRTSLFRPWASAIGTDAEAGDAIEDETEKSMEGGEERCGGSSAFLRSFHSEKTSSSSSQITDARDHKVVQEFFASKPLTSALRLNPSHSTSEPHRTLPMDSIPYPSPPDLRDFLTGLPTCDIASTAGMISLSRDSLIPQMVEMGPAHHLAAWDARNAAVIPLPSLSSASQPLLDPATVTPRWRTKKQRPKRFQCPHCQVSFSNNGQLKGHVRIHTGERPFACDHPTCGKTFTRNEELTRHKRIHTGVRPFPCPLCGKRFGRKDHLKKHVKTHQRAHVVPLPVGAFQGLPYFVGDCMPWF